MTAPLSSRSKHREGARRAFVVFAAVFFAAAIFSFTRPKIYEATASVVGLKSGFERKPGWETQTTVVDPMIDAATAKSRRFQTVADSVMLLFDVGDAIRGTPMATVLLAGAPRAEIIEILAKGRTARYSIEDDSLDFSFKSSDPVVAVTMANHFAEQMKGWLDRMRIDSRWGSYENPTIRIELLERDLKTDEAALRQLREAPQPDGAEMKRLELVIPSIRETLESYRSAQKKRDERDREERRSPYGFIPALPLTPSDHASPNHLLNLVIGLFYGLLAAGVTLLCHRPSVAGGR